MILGKKFLSIKEASIYLDCTEEFVRSLVRNTGKKPPVIPSYSLGSKYIVLKREDIDNYILSNIRRNNIDSIVSEAQTEYITNSK